MNFIIPYTDKEPILKFKRLLLLKLIEGIREFFPESKIILTSSTNAPDYIKELVDFYTQTEHSTNYHGCEWLYTMRNGIEILDKLGDKYHYYVCYDSILNKDSIKAYLEWQDKCISNDLDLIISKDFGSDSSFDTNQWFGKVELMKKIFSYPADIHHAESWMRFMLKDNHNIYVYSDAETMLHGKSTHWNIMCFGGTGARKAKLEYFQKFYNISDEEIDKENIKLFE